MICQRCGQHPATVHLTDVLNKARRVQHICDGCARAHQLLPTPDDPGQPINLPALVQLIFGTVPPGEPVPGAFPAAVDDLGTGLVCPECGLKYSEFRAEGRIGCPRDYDVFRAPLLPLLERIHRHTTYAGKVPKSAGRPAAAAEPLPALQARLRRAVVAEDYETAATLRDTIRAQESPG